MAVEIQQIYLEHPQPRLIRKTIDVIGNGGVIVYPTDTIYGLGVDIFSKPAMQKVLRLKKASKHKMLSLVCPDLKEIARWAVVSNRAYKIMRRVTPAAYTFILKASSEVPKIMLHKRKTVGIRIPDSQVVQALLAELGRPILNTSVPQGEDGYYTDPHEIATMFNNDIDLILDAGVMFNKPSTIVDLSGDEIEIIREGSGDIESLFF